MINIGIDVGKFKHCAAVLDDRTGEWLCTPFFFTNDQEGFSTFYKKVCPYLRRKHACGLESTGHYMYNLAAFLLDKKISTFYINPRATSMRRKELSMTAKNDRLDARLIAEMLSEKKFWKHVTRTSLEMDKLREIVRLYHQMQKQQNQDQNRFQRALDIVFPEYNSLPWTRYSSAYIAVIKAHPSASAIAHEDIRNLRKALQIKGRWRRTKVTAEMLKQAAKASVAMDNPAAAIEVQAIANIIEAREKELTILKKKIMATRKTGGLH